MSNPVRPHNLYNLLLFTKRNKFLLNDVKSELDVQEISTVYDLVLNLILLPLAILWDCLCINFYINIGVTLMKPKLSVAQIY